MLNQIEQLLLSVFISFSVSVCIRFHQPDNSLMDLEFIANMEVSRKTNRKLKKFACKCKP